MTFFHGATIFNGQLGSEVTSEGANCSLHWEECKEEIDLASLASKEPILFYDEVGSRGV